MSWLRDHFYEFVFPAFLAAGQEVGKIGEPFDVRASPHAPERLPSELRKLWTLCKEHGVRWSWDVKEGSHGSSRYREMARINHQVMRDTLNSAQAALRLEGCDRLFLGGRDVWTFAVMCERRRIPYLFIPELSRPVCDFPGVRDFLASRGFTGRELFLDTGFAGSIPRSLAKWYGHVPFQFRLMSQNDVALKEEDLVDAGFKSVPVANPKAGVLDMQLVPDHVPSEPGKIGFKLMPVAVPKDLVSAVEENVLVDCDPSEGFPPRRVDKRVLRYKKRPNQLFPNWAAAREEALATEYLAKYWTRGTHASACQQGHAGSVWQEWRGRKDVLRFSDPRNLQLGLTDGEEWIQVAVGDLKTLGEDAAKFQAWWSALKECDPSKRPPDRVYQTFADKASIQKAAMLTSMLWRGVPYWKVKDPDVSRLQKDPYQQGYAKYPGTGTIVTSNGGVFSTSAVTMTTASSTAVTSFAPIGVNQFVMTDSVLATNGVFIPNPDLADPTQAPKNIPQLKAAAQKLLQHKAEQAGAKPGDVVEMSKDEALQVAAQAVLETA